MGLKVDADQLAAPQDGERPALRWEKPHHLRQQLQARAGLSMAWQVTAALPWHAAAGRLVACKRALGAQQPSNNWDGACNGPSLLRTHQSSAGQPPHLPAQPDLIHQEGLLPGGFLGLVPLWRH